MKYILRIINLPFILGILLVSYNYTVIKRTVLFLIYGGEWINYDKKHNKKTILDVYNKLNENKKL